MTPLGLRIEGFHRLSTRFEVLAIYSSDRRHGIVARVRDRRDRRNYLLRLVPLDSVDRTRLERFRDDLERLAALHHPHVLGAARVETLDPWLLILRPPGPARHLIEVVSVDDAHLLVQSLTAFTEALRALHGAGIVHGLPKPTRLRLEGEPGRLARVAIVDPAMHALLGERAFVASRAYCAPELLRGGAPTARSDLYALGASFLEMAAGQEALRALHAGQPPRFHDVAPGLDSKLCQVLDRLLEVEPDRRPVDAAHLAGILRDSSWSLPPATPDGSRLIAPALVGREEELARIEEVLATRPRTHVIEIIGSPGCGRSRLLEEVCDRARRGRWTVLRWFHGGAGDGLPELVQALAAAAGLDPPEFDGTMAAGHGTPRAGNGKQTVDPCDVGDGHPGNAGNRDASGAGRRIGRFTAAMRDLVARLDQPMLLAIDDLDRYSRLTVTALHHAVNDLGDAELKLVVTGSARFHLPQSSTVELAPFDRETSRRFLLPLLEEAMRPEPLLAELHRSAGGRPRWMRLLLGAWLASGRLSFERGRPYLDSRIEATPPDLDAIVGTLIERLDSDARRGVELLALHGAPMPRWLLERLGGGVVAALERPEVTTLVEQRDGNFLFGAEAARDAVLRLLDGPTREARCRTLMRLLAEDPPPGTSQEAVDDGLLGQVLLGAGEIERGVEHLVRAARHEEQLGDRWAALALYRQALAHPAVLATVLATDGRVTWTFELHVALLAAQLGDADWAWETAVAVRRRLEQRSCPGETWAADDVPGANARTRTAAAAGLAAPPGGLGNWQASLHLKLAIIARTCGRLDEATALFDTARRLADPALVACVDFEQAGCDLDRGAFELAAERMGVVLEHPDLFPERWAAVLHRMAITRTMQGHAGEAIPLALRAYRRAMREGRVHQAVKVLTSLGSFYRQRGRTRDAVAALERAYQLLVRVPDDPLMAVAAHNLGTVYAQLDRGADAERMFELALTLHRRLGKVQLLGVNLLGLALAQAGQGRHRDACECLLEAESAAIEHRSRVLGVIRLNLGDQLRLLGHRTMAEIVIRRALRHEGLARHERAPGELALAEMELWHDAPQAALGHAERAQRQLRGVDSPFVLAVAAVEVRARLGLGDLAGARRAHLRGRRFLESLASSPESAVKGRVMPDVRCMWIHATAALRARESGAVIEALDAARSQLPDAGSPTERALVLIHLIEAAARAPRDPETGTWIGDRMRELEAVAASTDATLVHDWIDRRHAAEQHAALVPARTGQVRRTVEEVVEENRLLRRLFLGPEPDLRTMPEGVGADHAIDALLRHATTLEPCLVASPPGGGRLRVVLGTHLALGRPSSLLPILCDADPGVLADRLGMTERGLATLERARGGTLVLCNIDKLSTDSMQALCGWLDELAARGTTDTWVVGTTRPERIPDGKGRGRGEQEAWWELATRLGTPVILPSITERADQLPLLIETLVAEACRPDGRPLPRVPQAFVDACRAHHWPENIAELRRVVLAAVELARRGVLSLAPLPGGRPDAVRPYRQAAEGFDRAVLTQALQASEGNVPHAARLLGLPESTFRYKARKLELDTRDFEPKATDASD